jgi:bacterioferritin (cytochrome b1)
MTDRSFSIDVAAIRERANMADAAVTVSSDRLSTHREIIRWLEDGDITTRRLMESILDEEERHADDILDMLGSLDGGSQPGSSPNP